MILTSNVEVLFMFDDEMDIDFEKLRKAVFSSQIDESFLTRGIGIENSVNSYNANPEQLLSIARRLGINISDYKLKK